MEMGRKRLELERNYTSTLLILALTNKGKYLRELERELKPFTRKRKKIKINKKTSEKIVYQEKEGASKTNLRDALIDMEQEWLIKGKYVKNTKRYNVRWDRMVSHFINHISQIIKKRYGKDPYLQITKYKNNKYLIELLKISFNSNYEIFKKKKLRLKTMGDIFEEILYQLTYYLQPHFELKGNKKLLRIKELREFGEFSEKVYDIMNEYQADGLGSFVDEYLATKINYD